MSEEKKDIQDPKKPGGDLPPKKEPGNNPPEGEKTPEQKQIETLQFQKEHQREKREEAEGQVVELKEEVERLKKEPPSTPSETELPEDDMLTDAERVLKQKQETQAKDIALLKEKEAWKEDFAKAKKQFPQLGKREEEFKEFCYKYPKGIDATTLAKSFLFEEKPKPEPPEPKKPERLGLEVPSGGPKEVPSTEMTLEDIKRLRTTNPKLYNKMVQEGRFKDIPKE